MTIDFFQIQNEVSEIRQIVQQLAYKLEQPSPESNLPVDEVLKVSQAAKLLDSKIATIYGMVYERRIPFHRPDGSRRLYFLRSELIEWIKNGRKQTYAELDEQTRQVIAKRVNRRSNRKGGINNHE